MRRPTCLSNKRSSSRVIATGSAAVGCYVWSVVDVKHPDMKQPKNQKALGADATAKPVPFDLWLKRGLHQIYDDVAKEPIPDDLLKLIEDDRDR